MKTKLIAISLFAVVGLFAVPVTARAHDSTDSQSEIEAENQEFETREQRAAQRLEAARTRLEAARAERCEFVKAKLQFHLDRAAAIREHRQKRYDHISDRLTALADRMDVSGLDSSQLRTELIELDALIATYSTNFATYEATVQAAITASCEDSDAFKAALLEAKQALVQLRSNARSVHTFFRAQLKPLLSEIKEIVKQTRQDAAGENSAVEPAGSRGNQNTNLNSEEQ
jgi:flagellar basal body-associated protein FliL